MFFTATCFAYSADFALAVARSLAATASRPSSKIAFRRVPSFTESGTSAAAIAATDSRYFAAASSSRPRPLM
jgi:hypothetical protein